MGELKQKGGEASSAGHVVFTQTRKGDYSARSDNIEVTVEPVRL
jgi:hypothetical protein